MTTADNKRIIEEARKVLAVNRKAILPVTKAADLRGFSLAGLWRRYRRGGGKYSYTTFHAVSSGRHRVEEIEVWLIKEGFKVALKEAQTMQDNKK